MGEPAHLAPRPFASPYNAPKGSRLEKFLQECDLGIFEAYDTTLYDTTLTDESRDYFLKKLQREGLAFDLCNPSHSMYFESLLEDYQRSVRRYEDLCSRRRAGNPGPDYNMSLIALNAYAFRCDTGVSNTSAARAAAEDLGPGIRADHVKRAAMAALRYGHMAERAEDFFSPPWARFARPAHEFANRNIAVAWLKFQRTSGRLLSHADGF